MILDPKHIRIDGHVIGRDNVPHLAGKHCLTARRQIECSPAVHQSESSTLWNNLSHQLRHCENINAFKGLLKTHLFKLAYDLLSLVVFAMCYSFFCSFTFTLPFVLTSV